MKKKKILTFIGLVLSLCMIPDFAGIAAADFPVYADDEIEQSETLTEDDTSFIIETEVEEADDPEEPFDDDGSNGEEENDPSSEDNAIAGQFNEDNRVVKNPARNLRLKVPQNNTIIIGETFQIQYGFSPLKSDDYVTFKSYGKHIVQVDDNGLVTAVGFGTAKVKVETSKGIKKNIYFTVTDSEGGTDFKIGDVESIDFSERSAILRKGRETQIEPIIYPLGIYDYLTYTSDDESVATVSPTGLVTAVGEGTAIITVTARDGASNSFIVTVYDDILRGIDVSKWQGDIDWEAVSKSGIDFVMIRSSFGCEDTDICLEQNVAGCEEYGIDYGFYHYTYAKTVAEAKKEAKYFLSRIKNYDPKYPVVLDIEEEFYKKMSRKKVTDIIDAFMTELENAGYYATIYSYSKFFGDNVDMSRVKKYDIWVASWGDKDKLNNSYNGHYGMWQYSSTGEVNGIDGEVDLNYAYKDYAEIIRKNGLNGQS